MTRKPSPSDSEEIGSLLQKRYPEVQPYSLTLANVRGYLTELPGLSAGLEELTEPVLEAIQLKWNEKWEDAKGF